MQQQLHTTSQLLDYSRATAHINAPPSHPQPDPKPSIDDLTNDFGNMKVNLMQHQPLPDPSTSNPRSTRRDNYRSPSRSPSGDMRRSRNDGRSRDHSTSPDRRRERESGDYPSRRNAYRNNPDSCPRNYDNNRRGRNNNFNSNSTNFQSRQPNNRNNNFNGRRPYNNAPGYFVPINQLPFSMPFMSIHPMASYPSNNMPSMQPHNQNYPRYNLNRKQPGPINCLAPVPFSPMTDLPNPASS